VRVLLVEDDLRISALTARGLAEHGFTVDELSLGADVARRLQGTDYECVILDVMLPDIDGLTVLKALRAAGDDVPVILLTARHELEDELAGLDSGADDYLGKPFFIEELVARVNVMLRRKTRQTTDPLHVGTVVLDRLKRQILEEDGAISLTTREFKLLECLMQIPERVFTRSHAIAGTATPGQGWLTTNNSPMGSGFVITAPVTAPPAPSAGKIVATREQGQPA
jgi:two-component system, OmpR family, response regulator